jgi:protoporphyrinogen oxidase
MGEDVNNPEEIVSIKDKRVVILGAGPTGLGAAWRLHELGHKNWVLFERASHAGGLASSFTDQAGFTWDVGGHVQFSHYAYFDQQMDSLMAAEWEVHERESWIWIRNRFIPYPFQNNIRHLPKKEMAECLRGLIRSRGQTMRCDPANFEDWIEVSFGDGIARHFMLPYNFKVWAYPALDLSYTWVGERVARVDFERIIFNVLEKRDDCGWGPNRTFRFPTRGGTGEIWRRLARRLPEAQVSFGKNIVRLESQRKLVILEDGSSKPYDILISALPVDVLVENSDLDELKPVVSKLTHSSTHVIGLGLEGTPHPRLRTKCWMYFPEDKAPFYRATVFSNYSSQNVPDASRYWSLLLEISESPVKPVDSSRVIEDTIRGALATRLIETRRAVIDTWYYKADYGYPTPTLGRDTILNQVLPALEEKQVFSRGRFGAWKYEVSNQDHSFMQGVEVVERLMTRKPEITVWNPSAVNR